MKIKVKLTIGYTGADHEDVLYIPDDELDGLTEEEKKTVCQEYTSEWANNYIEFWWVEEAAK